MNRSLIVAVLTVTMIIMMSTAGHAAFAVPHNIKCDNCHGKFLDTVGDLGPLNACITCHSSQGEAPRMSFDAGSMANYFGTVLGQPATGSRSNHTFAVSVPYSPKAMVQEPSMTTNPLLYQNYGSSNPTLIAGDTTCIRCHNVKSQTQLEKPALRVTNVNDALCLDCHLPRKTSTHTTGSHPVAYRAYSLVYKLNTTAFRKIPLSPNANNPTAKLGTYMTVANKGKIVCSTCHAPHYADSSSATLGNRSTANGSALDDPAKGLKGQFQDSKGQLLRTDPFGATAASINVCSSCHKETANLNHNGKGQNVQCNHCHGAHVDYTGDGSLPNLFLVRRDFSNISTTKVKFPANANVKVLFNTATSLRWKRTDNKGICQICHTPPPGIGIHDLADTRTADCLDCHKHSNGFSAGDCTTCHGQPPLTSTVGGPNGKASSTYAIDESLTPHAAHADKAYYNYACKNCHYDGTRQDSHNNGTFQSVFVDTAGSVGESANNRKNIPSDYNTTSRKCANVYCHSNGKPRGGIAFKAYTTPSWEYGRNKIITTDAECTKCHQSGATLTTNAHPKHVLTNAMSCNFCHAATTNNASAITDRSKHANGIKEVKFASRPASFFGVFSSTWNTATGSCNNSCHTNGLGGPPVTKPIWTVTGAACGTCHAAAPTSPLNLHQYHYSDPVGPVLGTAAAICDRCHAYNNGGVNTKHANGVVDFSCAPCHPGATPGFTVGTKVTCESCHTTGRSVVRSQFGTYTAPLKSNNNSIGHGQYSTASINVKCTSCHTSTPPHIGALPTEKRLSTTGNALCNTCHIPSVMGVYSATRANLPVHGGTVNKFNTYTSAVNRANIASLRSDACAGCHDTHGTTNIMSVRTVINGQAVTLTNTSTGFITKTKTNGKFNGFCQVCHSKAKHFSNWTTPELSHQGSGGKNCLGCHKHKGGTYAFVGGGACGDCHGYPPASNMTGLGKMNNYTNAKIQTNTGAGGAHTVAGHIPKTAKQGDAWTNCDSCHFSTNHNQGGLPVKSIYVEVKVDQNRFKFNNISAIKYTNKTCTNASCHFKKTPNWATGI